MKLTTYLAITSLFIAAQSWAAVALQTVNLGGIQQTARWESGSLGRVDFVNSSGASSASTPTTGAGSIKPTAPGYRATAGYYSYADDFGVTASTTIQSAAFSDIQSVVFQRVSMLNPGDEIAPLSVYDNLVFGGGPSLTYTYLNSELATISVTVPAGYWSAGNGVYDESTAFPGTYYSFAYQWDLSGVAETITSVTINAPIIVHSSTIEAQIDISGSFVQVIPEPTSLALFGLGLGGFAMRRRR